MIRLRGVSVDDADAIARLLAGDTELAMQTAAMPVPYTMEDAKAYVRIADPRQMFAVLANSEMVGMVGLHEGAEPLEIGYWIGRSHWARGYATAAVGLLIEEARRRQIPRLAAEVFAGNSGSMRVLEKNGFLRAGTVRKVLPQRGGVREMVRFDVALTAP